tara:strand:+ start:186 stop:1373 length:1188 start_codon:yes stop_codon:yes gene_type:complete
MKVGIFCSEEKPQAGGGYTFQHELITEILKQVNHFTENNFCIIGNNYELEKDVKKNNISFLKIKKQNIFENALIWLKRSSLILERIIKYDGPLEKLCKKNSIDLVWFVSGGCFEILDTPYIATVYDLQHRVEPCYPEISANGIWAGRELYHRYFLSRASYVIVGTEVGKQEVSFFYQVPKDRIFKLPHPTPTAFLNFKNKNIDNKIFKIPKDYILYPAQFWSHKNHINLLHAIKLLNEKHNIKINLVLTGSDKGNLAYVKNEIKKLELQDQVFILGFVSKSDLANLYLNASMLAYVSLSGPENLPPLEAFIMKCPVVASKIRGSEEQLSDCVLFCDPKNPTDIAKKIYQLLNDKNLKNVLIEKGYKRGISWTSKDFVKGVFKILDEFKNVRINWN